MMQPYIAQYAHNDDHHMAEHWGTYFQHTKFGLEYYKDIMLVHGFNDVINSQIGSFLFNQFDVNGFYLGYVFFKNIVNITALIIFFSIFNSILYLTPIFFFGMYEVSFFILLFLLLLKKEIFNKPLLGSILYISFVAILNLYWTTNGAFWMLSAMPLFIYFIYKIFKSENKNKYYKLIGIILFAVLIFIPQFELLSNYSIEAKEYIKGTLFVFGNNYGEFDYSIKHFFDYTIKYFALIVCPFFIVTLLKELIKNKEERNIKNIILYLFCIIFAIVSIKYTLGRIDDNHAGRIAFISAGFIGIIVPYLLINKLNNKFLQFLLLGVFISSLFVHPYKITRVYKKLYKSYVPQEISYYNVGNINIDKNAHKFYTEIKSFVDKYSKQDETFFDLNNRGMLYLYLDKKIPTQFVSYYNLASTNQDLRTLEKLKNNQPKFILINAGKIKHDNIPPSLRIIHTLKWILKDGNYILKKENDYYALVKNEKPKAFNNEELIILDKIFANSDLEFLPEAWGNSLSNLPLEKIKKDFKIIKSNSSIKIVFSRPIKGEDIDLLYFNIEDFSDEEIETYEIKMNSSDSSFKFKSKKGKVLIPIDTYPSWFLANDIKEIVINFDSSKNCEINEKIEFYKRKI